MNERLKAQCVEIMADNNFNGFFPIGDSSEVWAPKNPNNILQLATPHSDNKRNVCLMAAHYPHPDDPDKEGRTGISYDLRAHDNLDALRTLASNKGVFQGVEDCVRDNVTSGKADVTNEDTMIPLSVIWAWDKADKKYEPTSLVQAG
ncbi:uncharacterized protein J4E88_001539 [Alternaria novae-zelandiae]|uniref:uncharacterized protein n=1 Tax=Alternaria novae-zelandiae TaxID=430562 RepID=UPI0020C48EAD|nr:uncharacterized protein J4E88_001539 [Alternaria novae-zelandiae]KAI4693168.1 hypothetical protein J4E88_001539 [Alternaria novae-zelandiae]